MLIDQATQTRVFTPSDLTAYLGSPWVFAQELTLRLGERDAWERPDASTMQVAAKRGDEHERAYLKQAGGGKNVREFARAKSAEQWIEAVAATGEALADDSIDLVYQAHLITADGQWRGQADFLERAADGSWEPVDTKLARSLKPYMILQLCIYAQAIEAITGRLPEHCHVELGDGTRESIRTADFVHYTRGAQQRLVDYVENALWRSEYPWPSQHLEESGLQEEAEAIWQRDDHLVQIAGITGQQIERLTEVGLGTTAKLGAATDEARPPKMAQSTFDRLRRQAKLQNADEPTWELLEPEENRGFALLPAANRGDLFYDIEGDPLWDLGGSLEYLHGLWWIDNETQEHTFQPLWAHDREEERAAFEQLIDFFITRRAKHPGMHIYHYAPYETTALKRLARTYGTREEELDDLLRQDTFVDLYQVVRQGLQASVPNYSIKSMERFYMEERSANVKEGGASITEYERFRELQGTPEGQAILDDIAQYNEEDCRSTYLLRQWLRSRKHDAMHQFGWAGDEHPVTESEDKINASPMSGQPTAGEKHRQEQLALGELLRAEAAGIDPETAFAGGMRLVSELLMFNIREAKSQWWTFFELCGMSQEELVQSSLALGGLEQCEAADRGAERTFNYPPQDFKLRANDTLQDPATQGNAGKVVAIDEDREEITIKLSKPAQDNPPEAVFPFTYINDRMIDQSIADLARSLIRDPQAPPQFEAAEKLLLRTSPFYGEEVRGTAGPELREQLNDLTGSYLVAQGPPGTGKTYAAADLIVDQLIQGKTVGVTAGTHTAIDNLLREIEKHAVNRGYPFSGVKKEGSNSHYDSPNDFVASVDSNEAAVPGTAQLTAGTAWLFSRPEWRNQLDLIVIDEAGQFSLAYALAVGTAARTIAMVGDPNQLPQVLQGSHPIGSGASALEHVIGEHRTIPAEYGVFLGETRRLNPEICEFISTAFYESRLAPHECTAEFTPPGDRAVNYLPVEHEANTQCSEEEAEAVVGLINELGVKAKNVMVVSPYNMQVDLLRRTIDRDVKNGDQVQVFTVDKCQGQEAEVVIYSMATSGGGEIPRGADFLFSANRFNVAMSRGKRAAYLVCSPALLTTDCTTVREMQLVNAFVAFADSAAARSLS